MADKPLIETSKPKNKWVRLISSRAVWISLSPFIGALVKEVFDIELNSELVITFLSSAGLIVAYLFIEDFKRKS